MKKHKKLIITLIIAVIIIISITVFFVIKNTNNKSFENSSKDMRQFMKEDMNANDIKDFGDRTIDKTGGTSKGNNAQTKKSTTLKTNTEIKSALSENIELHATYYLKEVYVEENQFVKKGERILKYTNGTYLTAPYDCYIIELNLPDTSGKVLNSHYVGIASSNSLMVTMSIAETNIEEISVGLEATIEITSLNKTYKGNVTHIASTGNNGKFEIEIEFENDSDVKIGMTGAVSITI